MTKPRLVVMAGGTGGHVFPGLAVASEMKAKGWSVHWIGTADKMEAQLVPKYGFTIHFINIGGVRGKSLLTKVFTPFKLLSALLQAIRLLHKLKPNVVLGMGGYASGPGGIAARILGVPLLIHEQNAVFGMTNKYLAKLAKYTLTGFDLSKVQSIKNTPRLVAESHHVGNPIRAEFFNIKPTYKTTSDPMNILIVGGSLGALALNEVVPDILSQLASTFPIQVMHQTGRGKLPLVEKAYSQMPKVNVIEFIDSMESAFSWADIIICRAGALTVAEVAGAGRVSIFVPLPIAVDDHQTENAKYLSEQGGAILLPQAQLASSLYSTLQALFTNTTKREEIAAKAKACAFKEATNEVATYIQKAANITLNTPSAHNKSSVNEQGRRK